MQNEFPSSRVEALLMGLLALASDAAAPVETGRDRDTVIFKILSRGGVKGFEIAQMFGVSEATVSKRLKG